ncbi:MAG: glycoside hydrolase domain-containing protein [Alistipes onderdonkii]
MGLKIGLSYTSVENARLNLEKEAARKDFDRVRREANDTWEEALGRLRVEGGLHDDRVKFYTGLFHALLGRGLASDVNGAYPANDGTVGQIALDGAGKPEHHYYNTDAIWGAYWNLTQLWSIAYPEYYADWVASQLLVYKDAGWLGDGIACSKYVSGVGTNFTGLAIAAAYNCGIRNFDVALGYQAARKNELGSEGRPAGAGKLDVGKFVSQGYSPYLPELGMQTTPDGSGFAASHTLEYSFSAYAVAQMARQLGHEADYEQLKKLFGRVGAAFRPRNQVHPAAGSQR